jgi:hypothetical protein
MPLPRYQPVKKKARISHSPSLDDIDDFCLSKIIAFALIQAKSRQDEPYVGDNGITERNLSLVSKRWYFLTQTQVGDHGVHKINLEEALKREIKQQKATTRMTGGIVNTVAKTPRRLGPAGIGASTATGTRTPAGSFKLRPNYGVLSQRNMTNAAALNHHQQQQQVAKDGTCDGYNIKLFRAIQPKLLKYKHIQYCGSVNCDNFSKLMIALNSTRVERLDLLEVKIESAKSYLNNPKFFSPCMFKPLNHLKTLTYTITTSPKDDSTNALLWTIYQRAINLNELHVYLIEASDSSLTTTTTTTTATISTDNESGPKADQHCTGSTFMERLTSGQLHKSHHQLTRVVFKKVSASSINEQGVLPAPPHVNKCSYSTLIKKVLSEEKSVTFLDTNDPSLIGYLIQASNRLCTKPELRKLILSCPIGSLELLQHLIRLQNLGTDYLSIVIDNFDQIGEVRSIVENFKLNRPERARCVLNLYLKDQKFTDCEDKVKNLIQLSRAADINVFISALQRISIDCCHLMWSTGRALQASMSSMDSVGKCIFKITLQTYPVKPNTVNPFEITIPFGRCAQYKISSTREDVVRHREILKSLKKDCYHQFVKSVRENNTTS